MKHTVEVSGKSLCNVTFLFSLILIFLCLSVCVRAGELPKTAKLLPPETVFLVDIDNFSQLKEQFEKTNLYKLYKDPSMSAFVGDFKVKWREQVRKMDDELAEAIFSAEILPEARASFALVLNERTMQAEIPPVLLITQWGENIGKIKEAVEKSIVKAIEDGAHKSTEDYRGVTIVTITVEAEPQQVPDWESYKGGDANNVPMKTVQPPPEKSSYCIIDDCLVFSLDLEILKFVIAHIKGSSSPTLGDDSDYMAVFRATGPYHDIDFYVNIKQLIKMAIAEGTPGTAQAAIANLGFDNVASFGCSAGFGRARGSSCLGKLFLKINGAKKGICKMLESNSAVVRMPRFVPASVYSVMVYNLDIKKAYNELYNVLYGFNPTSAAMMYTPILPPSPEGRPGLQLKADIIDHLGSEVVVAQSIDKPLSVNSTPKYLFALGVNNRSALEKSLARLHGEVLSAGNPDSRRELLGHTIYLLKAPAFPFFPGGLIPMQGPGELSSQQMPTLAFTFTDAHLVLGTESTVEQAIRTLSSTETVSVHSAKWFNSAKLAIPSTVGLASLQDNAVSGELLWQMMKESAKIGKAGGLAGPVGASMFGPVPFSQLIKPELLPPFSSVRKYFSPSGFYGLSKTDGFFFEFNYLDSTVAD